MPSRSGSTRAPSPPPADTLRIHLFGAMDLRRGEGPLLDFATQRARNLFAYLVLHRERLHTREVLVGHFWGDRPEAVARKCLRTDLWRIRSALDGAPAAQPPLAVHGHEVGFNSGSDHWLDVEEFERGVRAVGGDGGALAPDEARLLQHSVSLYRGDLLEGVYDDWCLYERERLRLLYLSGLERLMLHHEAVGEWEPAIACGQRLLAADPVMEHVHRHLMRCHQRQGNRPAALRQFAVCERVLRAELDVEPMEETVAAYEEIRRAAAPRRPAPPARADAAMVDRTERLLTEARGLIAELSAATHRLQEALESTRAEGVSRGPPQRETIL